MDQPTNSAIIVSARPTSTTLSDADLFDGPIMAIASQMFLDIKWRSVLIALFYFYIVPLAPPVIVSSVHDRFASPHNLWGHPLVWDATAIGSFLWVICLYIASPIGAAYFAAKRARTRPLLHGLIIGIISVVIFLISARNGGSIFKMTAALIISFCSLFGSWLWRCQSRNI